MREKLKGKLRSRRGATLLLSLLLFLICAVAGSVAITAGTASSGTVSERAKMDQRYFSVTSAAELLREELDGLSVDVSVPVTEDSASIDNNNITENLRELLKAQSLYLISALEDTDIQTTETDWLEKSYTVTVSIPDSSDIDTSGLKATVTISRIAFGTVEFTIESAIEGEAEKFRLKMEYAAKYEFVEDYYKVTWEVESIGLPD